MRFALPSWLARAPVRAMDGGPAPGPPLRLRDGGHLGPIFRRGMLEAYAGWTRASEGRDFVVWAGLVPHVVLADPGSIEEVVGDGERFVRNIAPTHSLFGGGLLRLEGEPWRERRALLATAFRAAEIAAAAPIVRQEFERQLSAWGARVGRPFSPVREVAFLMLRILGRFLFGFDFTPERHGGRPLQRALVTLSTDAVLRHFLPPPAIDLLNLQNLPRSRAQLGGLCAEVLAGAREPATPFMAALRAALAEKALPRQTVLDELRTFLIAGHETSATALDWTLALLAQHPEVQRRARAEALAAPAIETLDDLAALPYLGAVLRESMRLYPPVPISIYVATRPTRLGALELPAGTLIDVCSYAVHRNPRLWPDPERFDPERFAGGRKIPQATYFPFLFGPHVCLGMRFAMLELTIGLAALLRRFHLSAPDGPPQVNLRLSLHPARFRLQLDDS